MLARDYYNDAVQFSVRFDLLWEAASLSSKTGRIKSFVDLLMGCECILKCDVILSRLNDTPAELLRKIKTHNIKTLAKHIKSPGNKNHYEGLTERLGDMHVDLRYAFDSNQFFFSFSENQGYKNYLKTIGNNSWVMAIRKDLDTFIDDCGGKLGGFVTDDLNLLFKNEIDMYCLYKNKKISK
ncbi:hypothetical protein CSQ89_01650 [Chitinimonas sp. BJB300]|nr:hypothetical protein CSQ89_01650 [Chitinimonas sp. BJB300]